MSDHLDGPNFTFPECDPRLDVADLYLFEQPGDPARAVVVFDVNPFAAGPDFHPDAVYRIGVDTDGDAADDVAFFVTFAPEGDGQVATVRRARGNDARSDEPAGDVVVDKAPVSFGTEARVTQSDGYRFFAGRRSEPFFFDIEGATNNYQFTGTDTFLEADIFSIIIELPKEALGASGPIGVWTRTSVRRGGTLVPVDRAAQPGLTNGFITDGDLKAQFITDDPTNDRARYTPSFVSQLVDVVGLAKEEADGLVAMLLPDLLRYDPSQPSGFPNGRRLPDRTFDTALPIITKGAVTTDGVKEHTDYSDEFPYLGTPHMTPPPPLG